MIPAWKLTKVHARNSDNHRLPNPICFHPLYINSVSLSLNLITQNNKPSLSLSLCSLSFLSESVTNNVWETKPSPEKAFSERFSELPPGSHRHICHSKPSIHHPFSAAALSDASAYSSCCSSSKQWQERWQC